MILRLELDLPDELIAQIEKRAAEKGLTLAKYTEFLFIRALEEDEKEKVNN